MPDYFAVPDLGRMRQRVTLQSSSLTGPQISPAGVPLQTDQLTWTDVGTYWASIEPQRIRRSTGVDTPKDAIWLLVSMRNPNVPVTTKHRFLIEPLRSRVLVIDGVQRVDEQSGYLSIEVTENDT